MRRPFIDSVDKAWAVLEEIAGRDGLSVAQLIERLYDELVADRRIGPDGVDSRAARHASLPTGKTLQLKGRIA